MQTSEIVQRIRTSGITFGKLGFILKIFKIPIGFRRKDYDTCILPGATMLDVNLRDRKKNANILQISQIRYHTARCQTLVELST